MSELVVAITSAKPGVRKDQAVARAWGEMCTELESGGVRVLATLDRRADPYRYDLGQKLNQAGGLAIANFTPETGKLAVSNDAQEIAQIATEQGLPIFVGAPINTRELGLDGERAEVIHLRSIDVIRERLGE